MLEEAEHIISLINHKMKHEDIAEKTGKSRSYVYSKINWFKRKR